MHTVYPVRRSAAGGTQATLKKGGITMPQAYCMKCRKKVEIRNPNRVILKNKRPATRGTCPVCGTKVFRIGKA